jgi:anti-sigma factor RsiW
MKCPSENNEQTELLLAYCAGRLDPETTIALERHLALCPHCREFEIRQRSLWQALDAWEPVPVSADFDRRLYCRIEHEAQSSWWTRLMRPLWPAYGGSLLSRGMPLAATLCLLLMAGVILERPHHVVAPEDMADVQRIESVQPDQVERALDDMEMLRQIPVSAADSGNSM